MTVEAGATGQRDTPGRVGAWVMASRPMTLPAAVAPVVVGTAMAAFRGVMEVLPAVAALVGALLIQIATNLANDYFDHKKGSESADPSGPTGDVQAGILDPVAGLRATGVVLAAATLVGV